MSSDDRRDPRPASDLPPFRCPACRAKQVPQVQCRRCGADLTLLVRAVAYVNRLRRQLADAIERGDERTEQITRAELRRIAPRELARELTRDG